jgi:hypothetical protein
MGPVLDFKAGLPGYGQHFQHERPRPDERRYPERGVQCRAHLQPGVLRSSGRDVPAAQSVQEIAIVRNDGGDDFPAGAFFDLLDHPGTKTEYQQTGAHDYQALDLPAGDASNALSSMASLSTLRFA